MKFFLSRVLQTLIVFGIIFSTISPSFAQAPTPRCGGRNQPPCGNLQQPAPDVFQIKQPTGFGPNLTTNIVGTVVKNVIYLLFIIAALAITGYFLWGAIDWIMSGGDKEKVASARKKMTHAIIGIFLFALAFIIIQTVGRLVGFNPLESIQIRTIDHQ